MIVGACHGRCHGELAGLGRLSRVHGSTGRRRGNGRRFVLHNDELLAGALCAQGLGGVLVGTMRRIIDSELWGLLLLLPLQTLALELFSGAIFPAHAVVGLHSRRGRVLAPHRPTFFPFLRKLWILIVVVFVVPFDILVLLFVIVPDGRSVAANAKGVVEDDSLGLFRGLMTRSGRRSVHLVGTVARGDNAVARLLKLGLRS